MGATGEDKERRLGTILFQGLAGLGNDGIHGEYGEASRRREKKGGCPIQRRRRRAEVGNEEEMVRERHGDGPYFVLPLVPCLPLLNRSPSPLTPALTLLVARSNCTDLGLLLTCMAHLSMATDRKKI